MGDSLASGSGMDGAGGDGGNDYTNNNPMGFINKKHLTPRVQKMKWTEANDRKLLLFAMGREISTKEYALIAAEFPEEPTPKAIQERLTKLRAEQMRALVRIGLAGPQTEINLLPGTEAAAEGSPDPTPAPVTPTPAQQTFGQRTAYGANPTTAQAQEQEAAEMLLALSGSGKKKSKLGPKKPKKVMRKDSDDEQEE
ncbi:hypothetical protein LTR85_011173 [Meristemomyces frigidus]|nr:hypothetical protein LTR85_011173 [Meristemomyces frigidus]